jgi:hypothetical protein
VRLLQKSLCAAAGAEVARARVGAFARDVVFLDPRFRRRPADGALNFSCEVDSDVPE